MEDWIRNVETLVGEDEDGALCPLLTEFESDSSPHSLLTRLEEYLGKAVPSQVLIDQLESALINDVLNKTANRIAVTWSSRPDKTEQRAIRDFTYIMHDKARRAYIFLYCQLLQMGKYSRLHQSIYKAVNCVMAAVIPVANKYPHNPAVFRETVKHFKVKAFLSQFCFNVWDPLTAQRSVQTKIPMDLVVPTMRRLGMMDLLDTDWSMHGTWEDILTAVNRCGDNPLPKIYADQVLDETSMIWKEARNSIDCRKMGKCRNLPAAPQCFQYFPKCSVKKCSHIETAEKPDDHRCTKCYYFHFCSEACSQYAERYDLHDCDFTPPEMTEVIKTELETYMGWNRPKDEMKRCFSACNFCQTMRCDMTGGDTLVPCTKCGVVAYCDKNCMQWDWEEHKNSCNKHMPGQRRHSLDGMSSGGNKKVSQVIF